MSDQLDQQNDPVFEEEQAHLSSLYQKLLQMRDAISADLESSHAGAAQDLITMSEEVRLDFGGADETMETLAAIETLNSVIDAYNQYHDFNVDKLRRVMLLLMIPFWTSSLIRLYGWIIIFRANGTLDKLLMGLGLTDSPLKLLYTYPAVVVGMVYALLQFMILAVYSSAEKMDWSLVEAARDLGATPLKAFLTVTLKLTLPGLLSGVILTFIPSMGLFFIADILGGNKVVLVGSLIQDQLMKAHNWPFAAALSVVLMILTSLMISLYKRVTHTTELEGIL